MTPDRTVTPPERIAPSRNYGIDLLRMLSMYMVCTLHTLGQGGILEATSEHSSQYCLAWLLEIAAYCAVDCFALISGYVGATARFRPINLLRLWLQAAF